MSTFQSFAPIYLHFKDATTERVYVIVDLPTGDSLIGYAGYDGLSDTNPGTWGVRRRSYAHRKEQEKIGKGYRPCAHTMIPSAMRARMLFEFSTALAGPHAVGPVHLGATGAIETGSAPPARPKRARRRVDNINVWL